MQYNARKSAFTASDVGVIRGMFYKPKFCNECGEKIERAEWKINTSRRYCDLCATEHPLLEWGPKVLIVFAGLIVFSLIISPFFGDRAPNPERSDPVSGIQDSRPAGEQPRFLKAPKADNSKTDNTSQGPDPRPESLSQAERSAVAVSKAEKAVYYCGAPTKKGTPCSRRVKTKGYCWQHRSTDNE